MPVTHITRATTLARSPSRNAVDAVLSRREPCPGRDVSPKRPTYFLIVGLKTEFMGRLGEPSLPDPQRSFRWKFVRSPCSSQNGIAPRGPAHNLPWGAGPQANFTAGGPEPRRREWVQGNR